MNDSSASNDPGWYPDPSGIHPQRFWDGEAWTARVVNRVGATSEHHVVQSYAPPNGATGSRETAVLTPPPPVQSDVAPAANPPILPVPAVEATASPLPVHIATPIARPSSSGATTLRIARRRKPRGKQFYLTALVALAFLVMFTVAAFAGSGTHVLWRVLAVLAGVALAAALWVVTRPRGIDVYPAGLVILVNGQPVTVPWTTIERIDDDADPEAAHPPVEIGPRSLHCAIPPSVAVVQASSRVLGSVDCPEVIVEECGDALPGVSR